MIGATPVTMLVLYSRTSLREYAASLLDLIASISELHPALRFRRYHYATGLGNWSRYVRWNGEEAGDHLRALLQSSNLSRLYIDDLTLRPRRGDDPSLYLEINMNSVERLAGGEGLGATADFVLVGVKPFVGLEEVNANMWSKLVNSALQCYSRSAISYGFMHPADLSSFEVRCVANGVGSSELNECWSSDIRRWRKSYEKMDSLVRGAYWGNFLGRGHLDALGGISNVRQQAFWKVWHETSRGILGALSENPCDLFVDSQARERLENLRRFVGKIVMPEERLSE